MVTTPFAELAASFTALTFLEIVLGIDNIVFLAVAVDRLEPARQGLGRQVSLWLAMALRTAMLIGLVWLARLDVILFHLAGRDFAIKDLVLVAGGLFLMAKGTTDIHDEFDAGPEQGIGDAPRSASFVAVMVQVALINIVFSLDSVITAVGMTNDLPVMIGAVVASTLAMMFAAKPVGDFIHRRPTTKMLALSFILLIGLALVADGLGFHLPRAYLYFAIAVSLGVELLNLASHRARRRRAPPPRDR